MEPVALITPAGRKALGLRSCQDLPKNRPL
jgi:hypothetical protein